MIMPEHVRPEIRQFYERDLDQLKRLEKTAYIDYPWTEEDFVFFLRKLGKENEAYVAEWREHVLGFILVTKRDWYYDIVSLAVSPEFRRIGVGKKLIDLLKDKLVPYGREDIYARVRASNKDAFEFFLNQDFYVLERHSNCYSDISEGCVKFKYELEEMPLKPEHKHL